MRGPGPVAARPGDSTLQPGAGGSLRRVLPSGPTPDFGRSLCLDGFRMELGALHSHVLACLFFFSPRSSKKGGAFRHPILWAPWGSLSSVCKFTTRYLSCFSHSERRGRREKTLPERPSSMAPR